MMTPEKKFKKLYEDMFKLCLDNDWGDPFSYARSREIHIAGILGHKVSTTLSGADGIDEDGECEYKSTIAKSIQATYNGISVQPTWEEQVDYLYNEKIAKYKNHYIVRYDGSEIAEIWKLSGIDVFKILLPKLENKYPNILNKKDPRLGANLTKSEIYKYGEKLDYIK
jgi:hypothetical protein